MIVNVTYTRPLRELLKEGGLWVNYSNYKHGYLRTAFQIFKVVYFLGVWILLLLKLFEEGAQFLLTPSAVFIPLGGVLLSTTVIVILQSNKFEHLVDQCEINLSSYKKEWEIKIIKTHFEGLSTFINFAKLGFFNFALVYIFLPLIIDGIRLYLGYREPYSLPTPLEGYLDKNSTRNTYFYAIIFASDVWFLIGISLTIAFEGIIFFMVSYTVVEVKILKTCLRMLCPMNESENSEYAVCILPTWDLKQIIKYHRRIIKLNSLQKDCITSPYVLQNLSSTLSVCFVMFLVRQVIDEENTMMLFLSVTFVGMLIVLLFVVCFAGEFLQSESEDLFETICSLPWYRQCPKARKDILLILTQAAKPLVLDYKRNAINLPAFMQAMNNSYSYFMLMNSVSF